MHILRLLIPKTLSGRIIILSLLFLLCTQFIIIAIFVHDKRMTFNQNSINFSFNSLASLVRILDTSNPVIYKDVLQTNHSMGLFTSLYDKPVIDETLPRSTTVEQKFLKALNDNQRDIYISISESKFNEDEINISLNELYNIHQQQPSHYHKEKKWSKEQNTSPQTDNIEKIIKNNETTPFNIESQIIYAGSIKLKNDQYLLFAYLRPNSIMPLFSKNLIYSICLISILGAILLYFVVKSSIKPLKMLSLQAKILSRDYNAKPLSIKEGPLEIVELLESFNRMQQKISSFIDDRTRILASISHDLKTPLTSMKLRTELMDDSEDKFALIKTVDTMTEMVKATLLFAKGAQQSEPATKINIVDFISDICNTYKECNKNVSFENYSQCKNGQEFLCIKTDMHRILQNIIDNGLEYGKNVTVVINEDEHDICIKINDDGPGIPKELHDKVFAPFMRLDTARNTTNGHVGLGLSIVRNMVLKQGGTISLENIEPQGLSVIITFKKS